jgi:leucine dehydrogenase
MTDASVDDITKLPEFDKHELVAFVSDEKAGLRGVIAIHRGGTAAHPALGATRLWKYPSFTEAVRDALRLSRLMSYKSAIAGFKYGGAKGVLMFPNGAVKERKQFFEAYAGAVERLGGGFITGTDVGVTDDDVKIMKQKTHYVIGSQLDPAHYTAIGVVEGIKVSLEHAFGSDSLANRSFAIQGLGKVGLNILKMLYNEGKEIYVADIDKKKTTAIKKEFPKVIVVGARDIHKQSVDVFVPCALSGVVNERSIAEFHCKVIAGSANNQLADEASGIALDKAGILYAPDYMINIGGYIGVVDEFENGIPSEKRILQRITNMEDALGMVFETAGKDHEAPSVVADHIAQKILYNAGR